MFKRILVPLDGSPRAERALVVAARLARATDGTVVLLQAVGIPPEYSAYVYGPYLAQPYIPGEEVLGAKEDEAKTYIETVRKSYKLAGVKVEAKVVVGAAALAIQDIAGEENIDLIVMCSHGDTGFKRLVLGSVAQRVSRACQVPVLVLRADGTTPDSSFPDPLRPLRSIIALVASDWKLRPDCHRHTCTRRPATPGSGKRDGAHTRRNKTSCAYTAFMFQPVNLSRLKHERFFRLPQRF